MASDDSSAGPSMIGMVVALLCNGVYGSFYAFPLWVPEIEKQFNIHATRVSALAACFYVGNLLISFPGAGTLADKVGFRATALVSACGVIVGWALVLAAIVPDNSSILLLGLGFVILGASSGCAWFLAFMMGAFRLGFGTAKLESWSASIAAMFALGGAIGSIPSFLGATLKPVLIGVGVANAVAALFLAAAMWKNLPGKPDSEDPSPQDAVASSPKLCFGFKRCSMRAFLVGGLMFLTLGLGAAYTISLGNIASAFNMEDKEIAFLTFWFNVAQIFGRVGVTYACYVGVPTLPIVSVIAVVYFFMFLASWQWVVTVTGFWITAMIQSTVYGAAWSIALPIASLLRAEDNDPNKATQWLMPAGGIGVLIASSGFGKVMDAEERKDCYGHSCFEASMLMLLIAAAVLLCVCFALFLQDLAKRRVRCEDDPEVSLQGDPEQ